MVQFSLRMEDDVANELTTLSNILGVSKNALLNMLIRQEFNKYESDPKIKKALEQLGEFRKLIERFNDENKQLA